LTDIVLIILKLLLSYLISLFLSDMSGTPRSDFGKSRVEMLKKSDTKAEFPTLLTGPIPRKPVLQFKSFAERAKQVETVATKQAAEAAARDRIRLSAAETKKLSEQYDRRLMETIASSRYRRDEDDSRYEEAERVDEDDLDFVAPHNLDSARKCRSRVADYSEDIESPTDEETADDY
jgi:hypothetical protein